MSALVAGCVPAGISIATGRNGSGTAVTDVLGAGTPVESDDAVEVGVEVGVEGVGNGFGTGWCNPSRPSSPVTAATIRAKSLKILVFLLQKVVKITCWLWELGARYTSIR